MKKILFLIETENSKFLVIKQKNGWILPILTSEYEYNEKKICEEIKNKYHLEVDDIINVEESSKYVLLKCRLRNKYNKNEFKEDILNNIFNILSFKYQKEIIKNVLFKIHKELLNDAIWLGWLIKAKGELKNISLKTIITSFILFNSTIFCDEVLNYGFGYLKSNSNVSKNMIKKLRNYYLKEFPSFTSKKTKNIIDSMGINLNQYDFDIRVYTYNNKIIDINSRMWMENHKGDYDLYNGIVLTSRNWIKNLFPELEKIYEEVCEPFIDLFKSEFKKINIKNHIYSTYKLLDKKLDENSKIYILQRIGLLKTVMLMSNLFFKKINISSNKMIEINFDKLLRKYKAIIIEMLGKDRENVPILKKIFDNNPIKLNNEFFKLNRICRNNLHYGFYNELTKEEIEILDSQQDIYLNYVIDKLEKYIKIKFNFSHYFLLGLAFLDHWANENS